MGRSAHRATGSSLGGFWPRGALAVLAALALGCGARHGREQYTVASARRADLILTVAAKGSLEALDQVNVVSEVSGNVKDVYVRVNDSVEAGQPLCQLDPEHWQLMVSRAEAQQADDHAAWQGAQEALKAANLALERAERRSPKGPKTAAAIEALKASVAQAHADEQLAAARITASTAALDTARTALDQTLIRAPMSGVVVARAAEPGQPATSPTSAPILFVLARDLRRMELHAFVPEDDVAQLAPGQSAEFIVEAYPDRRFPARLSAIRNIAMRQNEVVGFEVLLEVDNTGSMLHPDMLADVVITTAERKAALLVPNAALRFTPEFVLREAQRGARISSSSSRQPAAANDTARTLWAVSKDGTASARRVSVGLSDGAWTEVPGDAVQPSDIFAVDAVVGRD
jgi:HlyD family secretion protein